MKQSTTKFPCVITSMDELPDGESLTALYPRLSRDDDNEGESNSIGNQKKLLKKIAKDRECRYCMFFVDDGYSGTNFNRPGFQSMIRLVEEGYIKTIIVKDMSRLGRNYLEVGYYMETFFPEHDVHFIAHNDGVDSEQAEDDFLPFRNIMNEWYAKDISRKIRSTKRIKGNAGEPLSPPPYGYMKDPANPKRWIIDDESAQVVRRIFNMCLEGYGIEQTARKLEAEKILIPNAYHQSKGHRKVKSISSKGPYCWCKSTVGKILTNREYLGDVINFKTYSKSYKNKKRLDNPEENWAVFEGVHEPIIKREVWEAVQKSREKTKKRQPKQVQKHMFAGLLYCSDCGSKLHYNVNHPNTEIQYFNCGNYRNRGRNCATTHYVRADFLEEVVLQELRRITYFVSHYEDAFVKIVMDKVLREMQKEGRKRQEELQAMINRNDELDTLFERLYEDNVSGKVSDERYNKMSQKYENEQAELKQKIILLKKEVGTEVSHIGNADEFLSLVRQYTDIKRLSPKLLRTFIDRIDVHHAEKVGSERVQRIDIKYNCIGSIEIPELDELPKVSVTMGMRKGVALSYAQSRSA